MHFSARRSDEFNEHVPLIQPSTSTLWGALTYLDPRPPAKEGERSTFASFMSPSDTAMDARFACVESAYVKENGYGEMITEIRHY